MTRIPASARRWALPALAWTALAVTGCQDQNAPSSTPEDAFLDGDGLFASAYVSTAILRYQHEVVEKAQQMVENGIPSIRETGCQGTGERLFLRDPDDPNRVEVRHGSAVNRPVNEIDINAAPAPPYVSACSDPVRLSISGYMIIEFLSMSPLHYMIEMPMVWHYPDPSDPNDTFKAIPRGMTYELPASYAGGAILDVTTPGSLTDLKDPFYDLAAGGAVAGYSGSGGTMDCLLQGAEVMVTGTVRIEERVQQILLVEDLDLRYAYDPTTTPTFASWPSGGYSIAALSVQGFLGVSISTPVDVSFDGFGGVSYPLGDRTCGGSLLDIVNGNPCAGL